VLFEEIVFSGNIATHWGVYGESGTTNLGSGGLFPFRVSRDLEKISFEKRENFSVGVGEALSNMISSTRGVGSERSLSFSLFLLPSWVRGGFQQHPGKQRVVL